VTRTAKTLFATAIAAGLTGIGAAVFSSLVAIATPFDGFTPPTCGVGEDCSSATFAASTASGSGFVCDAALAECFDPGPGTCNEIGTDGSGRLILGGTDCNPDIRFGDSSILAGNSWSNINGAINCDGNCQIRDSGNGTLPINTTGGVTLNSTSAITGLILLDVVVDIASIAAGSCDDVTATVTGVEANDGVFVTPSAALAVADVLLGHAAVTNAGTDEVTFRACNVSAGALDPASATYRFWVVRKA
jgi:hypothetical protein